VKKKEFVTRIRKTKKGWCWAVIDWNGIKLAIGTASSKKYAEQQAKDLVGLYEKQFFDRRTES